MLQTPARQCQLLPLCTLPEVLTPQNGPSPSLAIAFYEAKSTALLAFLRVGSCNPQDFSEPKSSLSSAVSTMVPLGSARTKNGIVVRLGRVSSSQHRASAVC
jgi:hypothetical protein